MKPKVIPVAIGLIIQNGKTLLGKRTSGEFIDFWEFPGGKIEEKESSFDALVRELQEELAITVHSANEVIHIKEQHPHIMFHLQVWHVKKFSGSILANEQQELQWACISKLNSINIIPTNAPIIQYLEQLPAESHA